MTTKSVVEVIGKFDFRTKSPFNTSQDRLYIAVSFGVNPPTAFGVMVAVSHGLEDVYQTWKRHKKT